MTSAPFLLSSPRLSYRGSGFAVAVAAAALLSSTLGWQSSQAQPKPPQSVVTAPPTAQQSRSAARNTRVTKPQWNELSSAQRAALAPLEEQWEFLSETQKRKWLVVSHNYREMPLPEQVRLHGRMDEWVSLSPQQRRTARLNFAETKRLDSDEKQEKWQAYQALSADDKQKFTDIAVPPPPGAAAAVTRIPRQKLAKVPAAEPDRVYRPRIASPDQIDPNTLLPQRGAAATLLSRQNSP